MTMTAHALPAVANATPLPLAEVPDWSFTAFRAAVLDELAAGNFLSAFFGVPDGPDAIRLYAVVTRPDVGTIGVAATRVIDSFPSLTPDAPQAHWFEREIAEQWAVVPVGHPWLKPIRFHPSYRDGHDAWRRPSDHIHPGVTDFFRAEGSEAHEVAVGPVHAGIIEPGHFRFQCHGEEVLHLEIALGYQHRGIERRLVNGPDKRTIVYMETLAGDTTIAHTTAYCQAVEALAGLTPPPRAHALRGVALELERLANHTGDLGALAGDVGFLPTASYCGRLRGDFLNTTAELCGSRFGRGLVRPGGVAFDADPPRATRMAERVAVAIRDLNGAHLLWNSVTVQARFEGTGVVSQRAALEVGLVGPAARACGVERDVRYDFPTGIWQYTHIPVAVLQTGDVFARAYIRALEIERSAAFVGFQLANLPEGPVRRPCELRLAPDSLVVSLVEGWRGEVCHVALTNADGRFSAYKVVDPSFHNWFGLTLALRNQQISDFPLCNKSFNLSYCGHDL
ncbi:NADH dehydrogenase (ubiquinone) 30 kDa subunit [Isosphaera pallida ATCC 43644]|uniref:NADH dehydrogenase (Ubiquinone) 30 kDa subunit n=1 Tax=Isosphaera pallida (strain ATCC 43644 / DSM 9630 / IS1B) TaxID=575540 RepID=E8QXY1_ISOPI|nr:NADH-quinone oxidoreductase subunit C [Isosphaera pallida]ADV60960.1 NADH dehydrogenase (ubiquinone) 30 kDa subunit [Isosphaera pallida ATCC 43644]